MQKRKKTPLTCVGATALAVQLRRTVEVEHPGASLSCETEPGTETKVSAPSLGKGSTSAAVRFRSVVEHFNTLETSLEEASPCGKIQS